MHRPRSLQRGFTLIELLVALALLAIASSIAFQGLSSIGIHRDRVDAQRVRSMQLERTVAQLQADIDMLAVSTQQTAQPLPPAVQRRGDSLLLLRRPRLVQGQMDNAVEVVRYHVSAGQLQRSVLGRAIDPLTLLAAARDPEVSGRSSLAMLREATGLQMQIWQEGQWQPMPAEEQTSGQQLSAASTDPAATGPSSGADTSAGASAGTLPIKPLPRAIKLRVDLSEGRSIERVFLIEGTA
jgi:prepilin-type N-terminal cleavage/methylation domain-containing protein